MEGPGRLALISGEVPFSNPADKGEKLMWAIIKALSVSPLLKIFYKPGVTDSAQGIGKSFT